MRKNATAILHGKNVDLWPWLISSGICAEGDRVQRVVIDIEVGCVAHIYVQRYGEERILLSPLAVELTPCTCTPPPEASLPTP